MAHPPDEDIWPQVRGHAWKYRRRTQPVRLVIIHSTRSGQPGIELEYQRTKNWFLSRANRVEDDPPWASMASYIIGHDGRLCRVLPDDCYPTWSAGHMDPIAISFELAQPTDGTPYAEATLDRAAIEVARVCRREGIPPRVLAWVSGDNREAPGISRHDRSDNGRHWGKSDPGRLFDDRGFERRVQRAMELEQRIEELSRFRSAHELRHVAATLRDSLITDLLAGRYGVRFVGAHDLRRQLVRGDRVLATLD
jgi:hypothetical protein